MGRIYRKILKIQHIQPNAPLQIGDTYYTYDAAGNPTSILNSEGRGKDLRWDAENRLRSISDSQEGLHHAYAYDHTGERILKRYGSAQQSSFNGKDMGTLFDFGESYSAYVSPYFVETNNGYTKHYYAGATRLVSKIGEGVYKDSTYMSYGEEEKDQYFYFQDHLGSSTYITTLTGEVAQYAAYTPYGELFREYRNVTPYKFNGKELDAETGLYYYGARYYNPSTALWLGVDPLASKYPGVSPYVFCFSNPTNFIDYNGEYPSDDEAAAMALDVYGDEDVKLLGGWKVSERKFDIPYHIPKNGFKSQLYERTIDGVTEYAYVFAGTDGLDIKDWKQNALQLIGLSGQYRQAKKNADYISGQLLDTELTFVGHSLGGGLATVSALATGRSAITFNTATVSPATLFFLSLTDTPTDNITNYYALGKESLGIRIGGDPLTYAQKWDRFYAPGKYVGVESNSYEYNHSIKFFVPKKCIQTKP